MSKQDTNPSPIYTYAARWTCHCGATGTEERADANEMTASAGSIVAAVFAGQDHQMEKGCYPEGVYITALGAVLECGAPGKEKK